MLPEIKVSQQGGKKNKDWRVRVKRFPAFGLISDSNLIFKDIWKEVSLGNEFIQNHTLALTLLLINGTDGTTMISPLLFSFDSIPNTVIC